MERGSDHNALIIKMGVAILGCFLSVVLAMATWEPTWSLEGFLIGGSLLLTSMVSHRLLKCNMHEKDECFLLRRALFFTAVGVLSVLGAYNLKDLALGMGFYGP